MTNKPRLTQAQITALHRIYNAGGFIDILKLSGAEHAVICAAPHLFKWVYRPGGFLEWPRYGYELTPAGREALK